VAEGIGSKSGGSVGVDISVSSSLTGRVGVEEGTGDSGVPVATSVTTGGEVSVRSCVGVLVNVANAVGVTSVALGGDCVGVKVLLTTVAVGTVGAGVSEGGAGGSVLVAAG
jgi:hypothetical protein